MQNNGLVADLFKEEKNVESEWNHSVARQKRVSKGFELLSQFQKSRLENCLKKDNFLHFIEIF